MRSTKEVTLITGAGSGIGRELTRLLTAQGGTVAGIDVVKESLVALEQELQSGEFAWAVADTTDRASLVAVVQGMERQLGPVDRLIACAGIGRPTPAVGFNSAAFEEIVRVNLLGVANSVEAVLPAMVARRQGHLVAVSSLASFRGLPQMAAYCASKSGLNALFDSLGMELKPYGIDVTTVCPGWVRTPMTAPLGKDLPQMLEVADAAQRILKVIRRRRRFTAFPFASASIVRVLRLLPPAWGDRLFLHQQKKLMGKATAVLENWPGPAGSGPAVSRP